MNKLNLIFTFIIFLAVSNGVACEAELYPKIYFSSIQVNALGEDRVIKSTDCEQSVINQLKFILSQINGVIPAALLEARVNEKLSSNKIRIQPTKLNIIPLEQLLSRENAFKGNWRWRHTSLLQGGRFLGLEANETLTAECLHCDDLGEKNIKLEVTNSLTGITKLFWAKAELLKEKTALHAKLSLRVSNSSLSEDHFTLASVSSSNPEQFVSDINNLRFFKLNKPITEGQPLRYSDLSPINLVALGTPVTVQYTGAGLSLSGKALPVKSGGFGDVIQLKNLKTNKIIVGKIVDFNKVVVEL